MEVLVPVSSMDFNFESVGSTPFTSAPASPKLVGEIYFSAPTSPSRSVALYRDYNNISFVQRTPSSTDPYNYDEQEEDDFAFDFSGQLEKPSLAADELFDQGKIRPLEALKKNSVFSPKSPKLKEERKNKASPATKISRKEEKCKRVSIISSKSIHRSTKSLNEFVLEEAQEQSTQAITSVSKSSSYYFFTKWKLKDFIILFRSASEGRADEKDPLKRYTNTTVLNRKEQEVRNSSFRSTDGSGSSHGSKRRGSVSVHELHYKPKKAVQDELKRQTYLPYAKGLLGCVGFNPTISGLARGLNSVTRR